MDRRTTDTRERLVELGLQYVMRRGYHAFSFQFLADDLGIRTAAVHYHFRTKTELVVAVLHRYGEKFDAWRAGVAALPPTGQLQAYFDVGRAVVADGRVCALAMIMNELDTLPDEVRDAVVEVQTRMLGFYTDCLARARAEGSVRFEGDPADKAIEVGCALVGAQGLARAFGPPAFDRVIRQVEVSLHLEVA